MVGVRMLSGFQLEIGDSEIIGLDRASSGDHQKLAKG